MAKRLVSAPSSKVGIFYEQEPFSEMVLEIAKDELGIQAIPIAIQAGTVDFRTLLSKAKTQGITAIVLLIWEEQSILSFFQQASVIAPDLTLATIHDGEAWVQNPNYSQAITQLTYSHFELADKKFTAKYEKRFGQKPILTASNAYDALNSALAALAQGSKTAKEIKEFLFSHELSTATFGKFRFKQDELSTPSKVKVINYKK